LVSAPARHPHSPFPTRRSSDLITVIGERLGPVGSDPLPWPSLAECDAVYFTAGDVDALRAARSARVLVATSRVFPLLVEARVQLDRKSTRLNSSHQIISYAVFC